ncbi:MAG: AAA family ATPase [Ramlibacter sp.]|nr:AAA family ATPase [Ramlibacter sp.]
MKLQVRNFAQIRAADIDFGSAGDLTILVGQQATGKSLVLQWLKLATDAAAIREDWVRYGTNWRSDTDYLRPLHQYFGEGIGAGWRRGSNVLLGARELALKNLFRSKGSTAGAAEKTYFIPAHRALLLGDGWPKRFEQHGIGTPYVAKLQSERLARWLSDESGFVYPIDRRLHASLKQLFDESIFHGASVQVDKKTPQARLVLRPNQRAAAIPFMSWTAGQREFVPLLLALYELMPAGGAQRLRQIETVVLEEPELGLHPAALVAVCVAVLFLMSRGYRVAISTHSPVLIDFAWALNRFRECGDKGIKEFSALLKSFGMGNESAPLARSVLGKTARTYYLGYSGSKVVSKDISGLRAEALDSDESTWGHLLDYSVRIAEAVTRLPAEVL